MLYSTIKIIKLSISTQNYIFFFGRASVSLSQIPCNSLHLVCMISAWVDKCLCTTSLLVAKSYVIDIQCGLDEVIELNQTGKAQSGARATIRVEWSGVPSYPSISMFSRRWLDTCYPYGPSCHLPQAVSSKQTDGNHNTYVQRQAHHNTITFGRFAAFHKWVIRKHRSSKSPDNWVWIIVMDFRQILDKRNCCTFPQVSSPHVSLEVDIGVDVGHWPFYILTPFLNAVALLATCS